LPAARVKRIKSNEVETLLLLRSTTRVNDNMNDLNKKVEVVAHLINDLRIHQAADSQTIERALSSLVELLIIVAMVYGCQMIVGEDLASLKILEHDCDVKKRWRNWRYNTTLRSSITDLLRYKTRLAGLRLRFEFPRGTSYTCPRCGKAVHTLKSSVLNALKSDCGAWLRFEHVECSWTGSRDYAGALNIGRLGGAYLVQVQLAKNALFALLRSGRIFNQFPTNWCGANVSAATIERGNTDQGH